jgi:hypothetical protein
VRTLVLVTDSVGSLLSLLPTLVVDVGFKLNHVLLPFKRSEAVNFDFDDDDDLTLFLSTDCTSPRPPFAEDDDDDDPLPSFGVFVFVLVVVVILRKRKCVLTFTKTTNVTRIPPTVTIERFLLFRSFLVIFL